MKHWLKLVPTIFDYGLLSSQKIGKFSLYFFKNYQERNMFVAERFMSDLMKSFGKHSVSTDGEGTW